MGGYVNLYNALHDRLVETPEFAGLRAGGGEHNAKLLLWEASEELHAALVGAGKRAAEGEALTPIIDHYGQQLRKRLRHAGRVPSLKLMEKLAHDTVEDLKKGIQ
jgi:hypothetical protein